ncbi:hypothetical protein L1987_14253 [Smallanthus sonchifolius]|uniref:Uncharacterized protein n=1 Tax=Smallanthus sonchifolius TaxID=185202 RepID=A0ACB9J2E0_9ASTR|nr:hypothetical protein L1987_14253 [Smallanthus sonchifolius]
MYPMFLCPQSKRLDVPVASVIACSVTSNEGSQLRSQIQQLKTSALTMNVAGVVKDWLLITFSWSVIKDTVTPVNLFEYRVAFLGVGYYNHAKLQSLKVKEAEKKHVEEVGKLLEENKEDDGSRKNESSS